MRLQIPNPRASGVLQCPPQWPLREQARQLASVLHRLFWREAILRSPFSSLPPPQRAAALLRRRRLFRLPVTSDFAAQARLARQLPLLLREDKARWPPCH